MHIEMFNTAADEVTDALSMFHDKANLMAVSSMLVEARNAIDSLNTLGSMPADSFIGAELCDRIDAFFAQRGWVDDKGEPAASKAGTRSLAGRCDPLADVGQVGELGEFGEGAANASLGVPIAAQTPCDASPRDLSFQSVAVAQAVPGLPGLPSLSTSTTLTMCFFDSERVPAGTALYTRPMLAQWLELDEQEFHQCLSDASAASYNHPRASWPRHLACKVSRALMSKNLVARQVSSDMSRNKSLGRAILDDDSHSILPMQPLIHDQQGVLRFRANPIVTALQEHGAHTGLCLNTLATMDFEDEDRRQFAQLIGYSLNGYGELSYVNDGDFSAAVLHSQLVES